MTVKPVLEVRVDFLDRDPTLRAVCPGYESGRWRAEELVRDVFDRHLVSFALRYSDYTSVDSGSAASSLRRAAQLVYNTQKYRKRGEFGELLLHAIIRDLYGSEPAISKIFFKDSANDTVKGFDAVHIVEVGDEVELWLGEVKFYKDLNDAIREVIDELEDHLSSDYLRSEFTAITNKLDPAWRHSTTVEALLHQNTSLDQIFDAVTVPVLLTYDSEAARDHDKVCDAFVEALTAEAEIAWKNFSARCNKAWKVRLRLLLLPMQDKDKLLTAMNEKLDLWQRL